MLSAYFITSGQLFLFLHANYDLWLVSLSLIIAIITSCLALQIAGLARESPENWLRQVALISGSIAMGGGIWAMHFIGMLAFDICSTVRYAFIPTLASMSPAIFASWIALRILSQSKTSRSQLLISGVLMGSGIGLMHYSGMAAMRMTPQLRYDPLWFLASIGVAVLLSTVALWIRFGLRNSRLGNGQTVLLSGTVMGLAIAGMHYFGMASARFIGVQEPGFTSSLTDNAYLALAIALMVIALGTLVFGGNALLRYRPLYEKILANEAKLKTIVNTTVDGMITIDVTGTVLSANPAIERLFGWKEQELLGKNIKMLMPEPYHSNHDQYLSDYQKTGIAHIIGQEREVIGLHREGRQFPIRLAVGKAILPNQTLYVGFISDISERKQMQDELAASEQQFRTLIDNIPGVTFRSDCHEPWGKIFISDGIEKLSGWSKQAFMNGTIHIFDIIHPDDRNRVRQTVLTALQDHQPYVLEYRIYCKNQSQRWVSESARGVYSDADQPVLIDGVILDITEAKLHNAEFESTVQAINSAMAVIEFDLHGNVRYANDNWLNMSGYTLEEIAGQHHSILCLPQELESGSYKAMWQALCSGDFFHGEYCRKTKQGNELWLHAFYNPILGADGKPYKIIALLTDLSERKAMELALISAKNKAEAATAAKSAFLANMSHEIRTPMTSIIGYTDLLHDTQLNPDQKQLLDTVGQSAGSLLVLLNDILDIAKLEQGAMELEHESFSLRRVCQQVLDVLRISADKKGLRLRFNIPTDLHDIYIGDEPRIRQILINLIGNAIKFTETGEVSLEIKQEREWITLTICDTGIGMDQDALSKIFSPFTQADSSISRRFGGTGLGTTIARQLVEMMKGAIDVRSTLGQGSTFEVRLPLEQGTLPAATSAPAQTMALPPLEILIADDVPQNLKLLTIILNRKGHTITTANHGLEALEQVKNRPFDVILMDVQMPEMDGLTAAREIRRNEQSQGLASTPIIALTASVLLEDRQAAIEAGMSGFASKPIDLRQLEAEIARVLEIPMAQPL